MAVTKRAQGKKGKRRISYQAEVYVRGVRVAERTFETQSAAYQWHDEEKRKWEVGHDSDPSLDSVTFDNCVEQYVREGLPRLRKSSQQAIETRLTYLKGTPIGSLRMRDFGPVAIDQWLNWLYRHPTKENPARKSFGHELKYLTLVLTWYRNYRDPSFVVPIVKRHRERCFFKHVPSRRPDYFIKPDDVGHWLQWLQRHRKNPVYHHLATFMVLTGVRVGEACGLCWDVVDLEAGTVRIVRTIRWDHWTRVPTLEESTKTQESVRLLPLATELIQMLRELRAQAATKYVFAGSSGQPLRYNAIQSAFNAGFKALELPWRSTHICRHTFGTLALLATRDLSAVQASLGHRRQAVTERYAKTVALLSADTGQRTADLIRGARESRINSRIDQGEGAVLLVKSDS